MKKTLSNNNTDSLQNRYSRYVAGGSTETANGFLEWSERFVFARDASDTVYVVENIYENRLDSISSVFYKDPRYAWFIAQYNSILDPFSEIVAGRILLIPTVERMVLLLGTNKGGFISKRQPVSVISPIIS